MHILRIYWHILSTPRTHLYEIHTSSIVQCSHCTISGGRGWNQCCDPRYALTFARYSIVKRSHRNYHLPAIACHATPEAPDLCYCDDHVDCGLDGQSRIELPLNGRRPAHSERRRISKHSAESRTSTHGELLNIRVRFHVHPATHHTPGLR